MATGRRGKPFEPGNKLGKGRPPGSRNKRSELQELLQAHAPSLINKCLWAALNGDMTALRLCLERLVPVAKTPVMRFRLGKLETEEDWMNLLPRILKQASKGQGSAVEVEFYARVVESHFRCVAACDFDRRLGALEEQKKSEEEQKIPKGLVRIEAGSDEPVSNGTAAQETGTEEGGETETQARNQGDCLEKQIGVDAPRSRNEVGEKSSNSDGAQRPGLGSITVDLDKKKSEEEQRKPNGLECLERDSDESVSTGTATPETGTEEGETETQATSHGDCLEKQIGVEQIGVDAPRPRNEIGEKSSNSDGEQQSSLGSITIDLDKSDPMHVRDAADDS